MSVTERLLLDAMRHRLDVACLQVTYLPIVGAPEIQLRAGRPSHAFEHSSPYKWDGPHLYRTKPYQTEYESQIVHFGTHGSASVLQFVHKVPLDVIFDKVVVEHLKFHAALCSSTEINQQAEKSRLNAQEKEMVSWAAKGLTVKETAKALQMNDRTVEYRLNSAKAKLGVRTAAGAVYLALCSKQLD